jgi:heat shock protein HtpX
MDRDPTLVRRMALALGGVLVVDLAFAGVLAVLLAPWLAPVGDALASALGVALPPALRLTALAVVGLGVVLWAQYRYTRDSLLASVDADPATSESHPDLLARVERLATQAGVAPPTVFVVDGAANCFTVGGLRAGTLVVSESLLDALDDEELDAVLAHELAHLVNRDAAVLTLSSFLPMLVDDRSAGVLDGVPWWATWLVALVVCYPLAAAAVDAPLFSLAYAGGFLALAVVTLLLGGVALGALAVPVAVLSRRLARAREFAADRAAALLIGNPAAVASALETLDGSADRPAADARVASVGTLCLLPGGFAKEPADDDGGFHVSTTAHPDTDERVARLRDLTAELERNPVEEVAGDDPAADD